MDYGYQVLRHTVQQVFGNLGQAARLTLPLVIIPTAFFLLTNPVVFTGNQMGQPPDPQSINWGMLLIGLVMSLLCWCWCWAAVVWHRFVLLEEYADGFLPRWRGDRVFSYLGKALMVGLLVIGASLLMGIGIGIVLAAVPVPAVGIVLGFGLIFGVSWVATRVGLILPAAAIGAPLKVGESWDATAPVSAQIILPIFVIAIAGALASQLMILIFGATILGAIASIAVSWLHLLVNLALMTTLYGNLVEGRQLN